ncbi:hypothetical protein NMY22_g9550 [Coprinellus aureogranulatus]|nr:hypothetical protein NMY22_g9550 [Coprinellus aureogranulatus]
MKKVIYIIGPSSTGKTTLCGALAKRLGLESAAYVREVARRIMLEKGYSRDTVANLQMQIDIMEAHIRDEEMALAVSDVVVCDRSAMDPIVYAILTSSSPSEKEARQAKLIGSKSFQTALARYKESGIVIVLLAPVGDWLVDDGIRLTENQEECMAVFQQLLEDLDLPYRVLGADYCREESQLRRNPFVVMYPFELTYDLDNNLSLSPVKKPSPPAHRAASDSSEHRDRPHDLLDRAAGLTSRCPETEFLKTKCSRVQNCPKAHSFIAQEIQLTDLKETFVKVLIPACGNSPSLGPKSGHESPNPLQRELRDPMRT